MTPTPRIAVVTGATQGLGYALVDELARRMGSQDVVYLTGRNLAKAESLASQFAGRPGAAVVAERFDVAEEDDAAQFAATLQRRHGGVDIVLSNAVRRVDPSDNMREIVNEYVEVNNLGTTRVLGEFGPLIRDSGRLVVIASSFGTLDHLAPALHSHFRGLRTLEDVDQAIIGWRDRVKDGSVVGSPWPGFINIPSKIGQVAAVRVLAEQRHHSDRQRGVLVAAVNPGMMNTATSAVFWDVSDAPTPAQAAAPIGDLVLDPFDPNLYGQLSREGNIMPFDPFADTAESEASVQQEGKECESA